MPLKPLLRLSTAYVLWPSHALNKVIAMKLLLVLFLGCLGSVAMADEASQTTQPKVEPYRYAQKLDIAHVVAITQVPNVCAVVPMHLTYDDSKGNRHIMEYHVMGNGCTN